MRISFGGEVRMYRVVVFVLALVSFSAFAQNNPVIHIGVASLENVSGRSVPVDVERDRLVRAINQLKPDKKTHTKLEAVALDGTNASDVADQAAQKNCDYILYTTLTELRQSDEPAVPRPGNIDISTKPPFSDPNTAGSRGLDPEYRATAEYRLYNMKGHSTIPGPPFTILQATSEMETVSTLMDRIASNLYHQIKNGEAQGPMHE
jgi:hypothetical protein